MEDNYLGLFAYDRQNPEETDWDEDPETEILGEKNDLPTTWQVQLNLTSTPEPSDTEYLVDNTSENREYEQTLLSGTGLQLEQEVPQLQDYSPRAASD